MKDLEAADEISFDQFVRLRDPGAGKKCLLQVVEKMPWLPWPGISPA